MKTFKEISESVKPTPPPLVHRRERIDTPTSMFSIFVLTMSSIGLVFLIIAIGIAFVNDVFKDTPAISWMILASLALTFLTLISGCISFASSINEKITAKKEAEEKAAKEARDAASSRELRAVFKKFMEECYEQKRND